MMSVREFCILPMKKNIFDMELIDARAFEVDTSDFVTRIFHETSDFVPGPLSST